VLRQERGQALRHGRRIERQGRPPNRRASEEAGQEGDGVSRENRDRTGGFQPEERIRLRQYHVVKRGEGEAAAGHYQRRRIGGGPCRILEQSE
jgi:hypothetical protein